MKTLNSYILEATRSTGGKFTNSGSELNVLIIKWLQDAEIIPEYVVKARGINFEEYINQDYIIDVQAIRDDNMGYCGLNIYPDMLDHGKIPEYIHFDAPVDVINYSSKGSRLNLDLSDVHSHIPGVSDSMSFYNCKISSFVGLPDYMQTISSAPQSITITISNCSGFKNLNGLKKYACNNLNIMNCDDLQSLKGGPQIVPSYNSCKLLVRECHNLDLGDGGLAEITKPGNVTNLVVDIEAVDTISNVSKAFGSVTYDNIDICCTDGMNYTYIADKLPWNNIKRAVAFHPVSVNDAYKHITDLFGGELSDIMPKPLRNPREVRVVGPSGVTVVIDN